MCEGRSKGKKTFKKKSISDLASVYLQIFLKYYVRTFFTKLHKIGFIVENQELTTESAARALAINKKLFSGIISPTNLERLLPWTTLKEV